jgi:NAD(P)-dependent dehydrogenase (short-subunit alcohol dehydrogenase family)
MASFYSDPKKLDGPFRKLLEALPDMTGKTVAVTGCTSGTGLVFAKVAAKKGAAVICLNRPSARAKAALKELKDGGAKATHVDCDLASLSSVKAAIAPVKAALPDGGLDVLCCNAGDPPLSI